MRIPSFATLVCIVALIACSPGQNSGSGAARWARAEKDAQRTPAPAPPIRIWRPGKPAGDAFIPFKPLRDFIGSDSIKLSNGIEVDLADWPSVSMSDTNEHCTSTLIGPRTVLTAAHCVDAGKPVGAPGQERTGTINIAGDDFDLTCVMHDSYKALRPDPKGGVRGTRDYALCDLGGEVNLGRVAPEAIDTVHAVAPGERILLTGYGCTNLGITQFGDMKFTRSDGKLRMGDELIDGTGLNSGSEAAGIWAATRTQYEPPPPGSGGASGGAGGRAAVREPTLCPGDSGGPVMTGASVRNQAAPRRIVALNSAIGWVRSGTGWTIYSYVVPLATPDFRQFLDTYLRDHQGLVICGYTSKPGLEGCRHVA